MYSTFFLSYRAKTHTHKHGNTETHTHTHKHRDSNEYFKRNCVQKRDYNNASNTVLV